MGKGEISVAYMRKMATGCRWRILHEIHYTKTDGSVVVLNPGIWYTGIPYTQGKKKRRYSLFRFKCNLVGGIFFFRKSLIGNDCSSAVSYAWRKADSKFPILSTRKFLNDLYGSQRYVCNEKRYMLPESLCGTKEVLDGNSEVTVYAAYDALKPGDGLLQYDVNERRGHIMLVSGNAGDNTITIIDQKGFGEGGSERTDTSWRVDLKFSYDQLIEEGYLPIYFSAMRQIL